jgi:hypothetical protein
MSGCIGRRGTRPSSQRVRKRDFLVALARFLVLGHDMKSFCNRAGHQLGKEWADLLSKSPVTIHYSVEGAAEALARFLK